MHDLRRAFEGVDCRSVTTYIQSGNVLFESRFNTARALPAAIEAVLEREFGWRIPVHILTAAQLENVVENAPAGFGDDSANYQYNIAFLKPPMHARSILPTISLKDGVDAAFAGSD